MPPVKSAARIIDKWVNASAAAQGEYTAGVQNPRADWNTQTQKANATYKQAIQKSMADDRFLAGVRRTPTDFWKNVTLAKGPARWSEGISLSRNLYQEGFEPYRSTIEGTQLPDRKPTGDPGNIDRVRVMAAALHAKKLSLGGK